jgi:hypothetical protein
MGEKSSAIRIATPSVDFEIDAIDFLARVHVEHRLQLTGSEDPPVSVHVDGDHVAVVSELIALARFGVLVRDEAVKAPTRRIADVVNDVTSKLRRS